MLRAYLITTAGMKDTTLYKLAGNAVTTNVVYAIAKKIKELENDFSKKND